jgi:transposase
MKEFSLPLDIESLDIISQKVDNKGNILLEVQSNKDGAECHKCGKHAKIHNGYAPSIEVRHLSILDTPVYLKIRPVRYQCEHCDDHTTTTEQYDWRERRSSTTKGLDTYLSRCLINSTIADVARKEQIGYKAVESSINRQVDKKVDWSKYKDLNTVGIDEISVRKGCQVYVTVISVRTKSAKLSVIAVLPDRKKETVLEFFKSIPEHLRKTVKTVCTDMYDGFVYSAIEVFGKQDVVIDRCHVSKLYRQPLDALRIKEMKRLKKELPDEEYAKLEGMMWILRKQHECLSEADKEALETLYVHSPLLKNAHSYALKLTNIFNTHSNRKDAVAKIERWIASVEESDLSCFNTFIKTLIKYKFGIVNYFKSRKNSGFVEGLNNKIKVIKRRCYGFFKVESLFQRLSLDLSGFDTFCAIH